MNCTIKSQQRGCRTPRQMSSTTVEAPGDVGVDVCDASIDCDTTLCQAPKSWRESSSRLKTGRRCNESFFACSNGYRSRGGIIVMDRAEGLHSYEHTTRVRLSVSVMSSPFRRQRACRGGLCVVKDVCAVEKYRKKYCLSMNPKIPTT